MVLGHSIENTARTQDVRISHNVTFDSLLLSNTTLLGLKNSGFYKPSPIQLHGIPLGKCGFDLLLEAKSGTGKTAVFTVIALEQLDLSNGVQAVILAPTREIAYQICDVIKQIGSSYSGLTVEVIMGGLPIDEDIAKFENKKVHIVVGSPGRLKHLIRDEYIDVSAARLLVLDEADKLLSKSFLQDINYIFSVLPKEKQVVMSSATYTDETKEFIKKYVQSAHHVCPDTNSILLGITQKVVIVKQHSNIVKQTKLRFDELIKILSRHSFKQCLIFCNYQARIAELHKMLKKEKWPAQQLYGQQEQLDRLDALKCLQEYKCRILISTDLAARGIDASNVDLVINFEPPYDWQTYLHRIGRAGRFGSYGIAVSILSEGNEEMKFKKIVKEIKAPLNLTNLWTDIKFEEDDDELPQNGFSDASTTERIEMTNECLWKALTVVSVLGVATNNDQVDYMESFNDLCNAFNDTDIESFSDLMSSLDAHQSSKSTPDSPVHPMQCIKLVPVMEHIVNGSMPNGVKHNTHVNGDSNNNQILKDKSTNNRKINDNIIRYNNFSHDQRTTEVNEEPPDQTTSDPDPDLTTSDDELEQGLISTEIPSGFSNNKYKCKPVSDKRKLKHMSGTKYNDIACSKATEQTTQNRNVASLTSKSLKSNSNVKSYESKSTTKGYCKLLHKMKQLNVSELEEDESHESETAESSDADDMETLEAYRHTNTLFNGNSSQFEEENDDGYNALHHQYANVSYGSKPHSKSSGNKKTHSSHYKSRKSDEAYTTYVNWYNNLKLRAKQVELVAYYEEMAKLHSNF